LSRHCETVTSTLHTGMMALTVENEGAAVDSPALPAMRVRDGDASREGMSAPRIESVAPATGRISRNFVADGLVSECSVGVRRAILGQPPLAHRAKASRAATATRPKARRQGHDHDDGDANGDNHVGIPDHRTL
jgi:hypothetical protein